eukprot:m.287920 g.287920  ORF g.287920 m.287920 type:complete len:251 (-) comp16368_c0_seq26:39-791(-)
MAKVVTIQPGSFSYQLADSEVQEHFEKFTIEELEGWGTQDIIDKVLTPLELQRYSMQFLEHKIEGRVLLKLTDVELKELQMLSLGDRKKFLGATAILAKKKRAFDLEAIIWSGRYPPQSNEPNCPLAYYNGPLEFCRYKCCWCFMPVYWYKFSRTGFSLEKQPAPVVACCTERTIDFKDFRFLKDLERQYNPCCLCWCRLRTLEMRFGEADNDTQDSKVVITHPRITKAMESQIIQIWGETRLVASRLGA